MAEDAQNDSEDRNLGPTYKTLFLGACLIIGGTFGWWFSHFIATIERTHRSYEASFRELEKRLATMETGEHRATWERDAIKRELADIKRRVDK